MRLFRYKKRNSKGRISSWSNVTTEDILEYDYFNSFWWGRYRRAVARRVFNIIRQIQNES